MVTLNDMNTIAALYSAKGNGNGGGKVGQQQQKAQTSQGAGLQNPMQGFMAKPAADGSYAPSDEEAANASGHGQMGDVKANQTESGTMGGGSDLGSCPGCGMDLSGVV